MAFFTLKTYLIVWNLAQYFALACARRGTFTAAITFEARARTVNLDILAGGNMILVMRHTFLFHALAAGAAPSPSQAGSTPGTDGDDSGGATRRAGDCVANGSGCDGTSAPTLTSDLNGVSTTGPVPPSASIARMEPVPSRGPAVSGGSPSRTASSGRSAFVGSAGAGSTGMPVGEEASRLRSPKSASAFAPA